jgi:hypothetical protein
VSVPRSFAIAKATQTISFAEPAGQIFVPGLTVPLAASATSGLPVTLTSTTAAVCTVSGANASILSAGTCTITADQAGNGGFNAAAPVSRSFTVAKATQTISFAEPAGQLFTLNRTVALGATSSSGLAVSLTSRTPAVCTIAGAAARLAGPGLCTIVASQAGGANHLAATSVSRSFAVNIAAAADVQQAALPLASRRFDQGLAAVAPYGTGAVMAYLGKRTAAGPFGVFVQRLAANGMPVGVPVELEVPGPRTGAPDIAALANGGFVVVWQGPDASGSGIFAQIFRPTFQPASGVIAVNATTTGAQAAPKVAALPANGFAVVWQNAVAANDNDIMMRRFNTAGVASAAEVRVNTSTIRNQVKPDIATLPNGQTAVSWATDAAQAGRYGIAIRLYRATGAPLRNSETLAANLLQSLVPSSALAARIGTGPGAARRSGFVLAYEAAERTAASIPANIAVRMVSPDGILSTAVTANSVTAGHQASPALATLRNGAFALAFLTPDGSGTGIGLRLFGSNAAPLGTDVVANSAAAGAQTSPTLAPLGSTTTRGATMLGAWTTPGAGSNGTDLAARRFQGQ